MIKKNKEILGIIAAIFIAVIVLSIVLIVKNNEKTENTSVSDDACDVQVGLIMGPPSMGLGYFMNEAEAGNTYNNYSFTVEGIDYSALAAKLNQGTYDIITCPSNVSAILYNNKDLNDSAEVISINNLGLLHILTTDTSINSMEDLKGRTVYSIGEGGPPEYTFEYLLDKYGLTGQVNFSFRSTPFEVLNLLQDEPGAIALLPQPFVEVAKLLVNDLRTPIDVTKAWDELNVSNGAQSVTTVTVVRKKFLEEHRQAVEEYLEYAKKSTDYTLENVSQAAEWTEKYETFLNPDIALDAIPQCSICTITGNEMKTILSGFLQIMYELNPDAVGGKMPDDEFYYIPEAEQKLSADSTQHGKEAGTNNSQTTGESQQAGEGITGEQADGTLIADNTGNAENANGSDGSGDSDGLSNTGSTDNSGSLSSAGGSDTSGVSGNEGNSGSAGSSDNSGIAGGNGGSDSGNAYSNGSGNGYAGEHGNTSNGQTDNSQQAGQGADTGSGASKSSIEAGTYTVTANIWFRKEDSGLPLNPHITSSIFPPKDPVSDNAQLTVDSDGNCSVRVPVVIQSKVMTIQQLEGFSNTTLMGVERDGSGNITAVTLGLGKLGLVNDTVTDTCVATLQMGDLAMSISGFSRDQIWPAQFQMN